MSNEPSFKFTNDPGSALLYYGDEFVAKVGSSHKKALMAILVANEIMREEIDGFTKHVGAPTFQEAVSVLLRTKQQDEDKIEAMFTQVKEQAKELATLRAQAEADSTERDALRAKRDAERLDWLEGFLRAVRHGVVAFNDDPDIECEETATGFAPIGFRIVSEGCQGVRIDLGETLREAIDAAAHEEPK